MLPSYAPGVSDPTARKAPALSALAWPRRTERLSLRASAPDDAAATFGIRSNPDVSHWLTSWPVDEAAYTQKFAEPDSLACCLIVELDGRVIGDLYLHVQDCWAQTEVAQQAVDTEAMIGWVLDPEITGRGYATEAAAELLRICFDDLGVRRVIALCFAANEPSWRLMERIGMRREGVHLGDSLHRELGWVDGMTYALLADEWRANRTE